MPIERITMQLLIIVAALLERPRAEYHGYAVAKDTGLSGGTVQQTLSRLEAEGWLESRREDIDPHKAGRRPRRLYRLTGEGVKAANRLMLDHGDRLRRVGALAPEAPAAVSWLTSWFRHLTPAVPGC